MPPREIIRAVDDTNIIVSGTISETGHPARILDAWIEGLFVPVVSQSILAEMRRVLLSAKIRRHQFLTPGQAEELLVLLEASAIMVPGREQVQVCRDPSDDKFLEAALEGKAQYVVSGDQDLTSLRAYRGITIVSPRQFLALLRPTPE